MKSLVVAMFLALTASSLFAADSYSFVVNLIDQHFALTDPKGTRWTILEYGCSRDHPDCEVHVNVKGAAGTLAGGTAKADHGPFDVALQRIDDETVRVRCVRDECTLAIGDKEIHLANNATTDVPSGSRITVR